MMPDRMSNFLYVSAFILVAVLLEYIRRRYGIPVTILDIFPVTPFSDIQFCASERFLLPSEPGGSGRSQPAGRSLQGVGRSSSVFPPGSVEPVGGDPESPGLLQRHQRRRPWIYPDRDRPFLPLPGDHAGGLGRSRYQGCEKGLILCMPNMTESLSGDLQILFVFT